MDHLINLCWKRLRACPGSYACFHRHIDPYTNAASNGDTDFTPHDLSHA